MGECSSCQCDDAQRPTSDSKSPMVASMATLHDMHSEEQISSQGGLPAIPLACKETDDADSAGYIGELREGVPHGEGSCITKDGGMYSGQWLDGQAHGLGTFTHQNGDTYCGQWAADQAHGHGVYTRRSGTTYTGEWKEDKYDGTGSISWGDGSSPM
mmetsp:Transcript_2213/g.2744  ORF Transcript_2213/g.2744 Transcript_2213/m.2744 type:complete len:157 (-) Transcript_2213:1-471(-)